MKIKLYGAALSNYYNMVKLSLLEKGVDFEEVHVPPSQDPEYLQKSPMGKIPCIETGEGWLSEAAVIMDYLEDVVPTPALFPAGAYERARTRQIMSITELYIELPARRHVPSLLFGAPRSEDAVTEVRPAVEAGLAALARTARFSPYVAGADFSFADIYAYYAFGLASIVMKGVYEWEIIPEVPGLAECLALTGERETTRQCDAAQQAAREALRASRGN